MKKLIIFDLDGTLLDTIEDLANSVNYALKLHKLEPHPVEDYNLFIGNGLSKLLERALPVDKQNADMISMLRGDFMEHYTQHAEEFTKPYPGIIELLNNLSTKGYQLAVASNKYHKATVELVKRFFPETEFRAVFGQRDGYPVKPNPGILEEIIQIACVNKAEVLYVGDSGVDVATAFNTKVDFVGVLWGFRPRKELEEVGAEVFVENTDELERVILQRFSV